MSIALKANIYAYGITGAIITYYFTHSEIDLIRYSLLLPILLCLSIGIVFIKGSNLMKYPRKEMFKIRNFLELETAPDFQVLVVFLRLFAAAIFLVSIATFVLFLFPQIIVK
jgi:energy-coupling factor transporter transmembrane protein EcfT